MQETIDSGRVPDPGPGASRNRQQTRTLLDALDAGVPGPDRFLAPEIQADFDLITAGGAIGATGLDLN